MFEYYPPRAKRKYTGLNKAGFFLNRFLFAKRNPVIYRPFIAGLCSFLVPGLGQYLLGTPGIICIPLFLLFLRLFYVFFSALRGMDPNIPLFYVLLFVHSALIFSAYRSCYVRMKGKFRLLASVKTSLLITFFLFVFYTFLVVMVNPRISFSDIWELVRYWTGHGRVIYDER